MICENSVEFRECFDTTELRGRPNPRGGDLGNATSKSTLNMKKVAHLCQAVEPALTLDSMCSANGSMIQQTCKLNSTLNSDRANTNYAEKGHRLHVCNVSNKRRTFPNLSERVHEKWQTSNTEKQKIYEDESRRKTLTSPKQVAVECFQSFQ